VAVAAAETAWLAQVSAGAMQAALRAVGAERLKAAALAALVPYRAIAGGLQWEILYRYVTATLRDEGR
jgi:hypothetical protein